MQFNRVLISRTDNIGDVILTLPMAGLLKKHFPNVEIFFLGKKYTKPIVDCCIHVDHFIDVEDVLNSNEQDHILKKLKIDTIIHVFPNKKIAKIAKSIKIRNRIGTNRRFFHWIYCNKLVNLTRKNSNLHEGQLNIRLLKDFGIEINQNLNSVISLYGMNKIPDLPKELSQYLDPKKFNLIIHPKSNGSAKEWSHKNIVSLIQIIPKEKFNIFFTGSKDESKYISEKLILSLTHHENCFDLSGKMTLSELISFINSCDGLLAASTGPLHIAACLGKKTLGLYPPVHSMSPNRWGALGEETKCLVTNELSSPKCREKCQYNPCSCMNLLTPSFLFEQILTWAK